MLYVKNVMYKDTIIMRYIAICIKTIIKKLACGHSHSAPLRPTRLRPTRLRPTRLSP